MAADILAAACDPGDPGFCAPSVDAFFPTPLFRFTILGVDFEITRIQVLTWAVIAILAVFFLLTVRRQKLVPDRMQWLGESAYGFIRDSVAGETIGREGLRFAPYLTTLFFFILANNFLGIVPFAQIAPTSKIAVCAVLAGISLILFNWVGIKKHGAGKYFKTMLFPPGVPKPLYVLITPIEFFSTLVVRPFTLAVRLFANMFAGHLLLLVFALGTTYLLTVGNISAIFAPVSFLMSLIMTLFEFLVEALQAYVFTVLTATYLAGALAEEH